MRLNRPPARPLDPDRVLRATGATGAADGPGGAAGAEEAGNVILAVLVLMVVVAFTALAFAAAGHSLVMGADARALGRAGAAAELAVHEAFARIDGGETVAFTGSGTVDGTTYRYRAQPSGSSNWTVTADATAGDVSRAYRATIGRQPLYPFTLFVDEHLVLDRNTGAIDGRVGTNGTITITGPSPGTSQELYRPDGTCTGCGNPVQVDGPRRLDPVALAAGPVVACPADGRFEGAIDGGGGTVVLCDDPALPVVFAGEVTVDAPPLIVHVGSGVALTLDDAVVNDGGQAASFRLHVAGEAGDPVDTISATNADLTGLVYGPGRSLTTSATTVVGSLTLDRLDLTRGGRLTITADPTIAPLGSAGWRITDLQPTAPGP